MTDNRFGDSISFSDINDGSGGLKIPAYLNIESTGDTDVVHYPVHRFLKRVVTVFADVAALFEGYCRASAAKSKMSDAAFSALIFDIAVFRSTVGTGDCFRTGDFNNNLIVMKMRNKINDDKFHTHADNTIAGDGTTGEMNKMRLRK